MITGIWSKVRLVCCNNHAEPQEMYVRSNQDNKRQIEDVFYACPKYNPMNREKGEEPCLNRISVSEFEKMLNMLSNIIIDAEDAGREIHLQNYKFETKTAYYAVLNETGDNIVISVLNKRVMAGNG